MGKKGGLKTLELHGTEHFKKLAGKMNAKLGKGRGKGKGREVVVDNSV